MSKGKIFFLVLQLTTNGFVSSFRNTLVSVLLIVLSLALFDYTGISCLGNQDFLLNEMSEKRTLALHMKVTYLHNSDH